MERTTHSLLLTPLLYHNLGGLSRGFLHFFSMTGTYQAFLRTFPYHRTQCRGPLGRGALYLPLTPIVYHRPHTKSIGNVAQIREKMRPEVCANCELTKSERCNIMEILPGAFDLGQPKTKGEAYPLPISTSTSSYPSDSNHDLWTKQVPQPHR